jgi:hypothetical protein
MDQRITLRNGLPRSKFCRVTAGGQIEIEDRPGSWPYQIPIAELQSLSGFAGWVSHIADKTWVTPEVLADFALFVCELAHGAPDKWHAFARRT